MFQIYILLHIVLTEQADSNKLTTLIRTRIQNPLLILEYQPLDGVHKHMATDTILADSNQNSTQNPPRAR